MLAIQQGTFSDECGEIFSGVAHQCFAGFIHALVGLAGILIWQVCKITLSLAMLILCHMTYNMIGMFHLSIKPKVSSSRYQISSGPLISIHRFICS